MRKIPYVLAFLAYLSIYNVSGQTFKPDNFLLPQENPVRVLKSHNPKDSVVLSSVSVEVNLSDTSIRTLISAMYRTVTDSLSRGVGIAAPQVGLNKRLILVKRVDKPDEPFEAYLNPTIIQYSELKEKRAEGCLSIDNFRCEVVRSHTILLSYFTVDSVFRIEMVEGYTARIFQHEIDHLNGILFPERVTDDQ